MIKKLLLLMLPAFFILTACSKPAANITPHPLFSDNMVLQKGIALPVWGKAAPGGAVTVTLDNATQKAKVQADSLWRVELPAVQEYGGPHTLTIMGQDTIIYNNVMIGEVWICSGQSNMEMPLAFWGKVKDYQKEIANANYPNIRLFTVPKTIQIVPVYNVNSDGWKICTPENIPLFSSTGYFFGRYLNQTLDIPIGLIHTSWGGTPAEAWTRKGPLSKLEDYSYLADDINNGKVPTMEELMARYNNRLNEWNDKIACIVAEAFDNKTNWYSPELNTDKWKSMKLPCHWENAGLENYNGIVWYRNEFNLSNADADKKAVLHLSQIDDIDITYVNGEKIGSMANYNAQRVYDIPASVLKAGKNIIAVQVLDTGGEGGIWGAPKNIKLVTGSGKTTRLDVRWKYKTGPDLHHIPTQPMPPNNSQSPTVLYNGMIHPLIPFAIRGAIWYQGEANAPRAKQYRDLFKTMITNWRTDWGQGDFPFILTQLANYKAFKPNPGDDEWAELREAQTMALELPNTSMAVTIDIGNANDIHPKNKQDVGKRLALNALNMVYGKTDVVPCGPLYKSSIIKDDKIIISFDHVDGGLEAKGGKLVGFAIAGKDQKWVWADAEIVGETVVVSSQAVAGPVAVRYAWQSNPKCNLYNAAGLPASPFRTDDWLGVTQ